jgi:hypothetical protein
LIISRADHKIYYKCLPTKFSAVFFAVVVGLTWAQSIEAYDSRYIYAKGNGALVLQDNLFRKPTLDGYELNAVKKFGALLLKLKISAIAKIRLYLNSDGKVQKIVFLEGSPTAAQLSDLSRLIGPKVFRDR